jgi:hypothetical protein
MSTDSAWFGAAGNSRPDRRVKKSGTTTTSYPIVAQHELDDPVKRGPLGLGRRRENTDIPKIKPHEVLVWRVGARYVVDRRALRVQDETVVRASSVSIVSVRPGTEVEVSFRIDSQDASAFNVKVIFICSVVDPVVVVRDGQLDAADALLAYLRGYQDIFGLGIEHPISEINKVRSKMAIQIKAYMTHRPPKIPGIEITSATVQVETPIELGKIRAISTEQQIELEKNKGEALIASQRQEHVLRAKDKMTQAIGRDPLQAITYAHVEGGLTSQELADQVRQMEETRRMAKRMDRMADQTRQYAIEDLRAEREHEHELWERQQLESRRGEEREDRRDQVSTNIELLKLFADRGYLDTYNADIEDLINRIRGEKSAPELARDDQQAELTNGQEQQSRGSEDENDN